MTAWIPPATWANGTLTAAFSNAEVRDHLIWLKAALDLVTGASAADTGNMTFLQIRRAATGLTIVDGGVTGDVGARIQLSSTGAVNFGPGTGVTDISLSRAAAGGGLELNGFLRTERGAGLAVLAARTTGDAQDRLQVLTDGSLFWGSGAAVQDSLMRRADAGVLELPAGPETMLRLTGATVGVTKADYRLTGDTNPRLRVTAGGSFVWGSGAAAGDASLGRVAGAQLLFSETQVDFSAVAVNRTFSGYRVSADAFDRLSFEVDSSGFPVIRFGSGSAAGDVTMFRAVANQLRTSDDFRALGVLITKTKAGTPTDADFLGTATDGAIIVDTTASKIWARVGGVWKGVVIA